MKKVRGLLPPVSYFYFLCFRNIFLCAKIPIMRILSCILLLFICCVLPYTGASALDVYGATFTNGDYVVNEDVTIHHGAAFEAHNLKISDSLRIINDGEISGGVDVCAGCTME